MSRIMYPRILYAALYLSISMHILHMNIYLLVVFRKHPQKIGEAEGEGEENVTLIMLIHKKNQTSTCTDHVAPSNAQFPDASPVLEGK